MYSLKENLYEAILQASNYLIKQQSKDGAFRDFLLPPGESDSWITGFVSICLDNTFQTIPSLKTSQTLHKAAQFLLNHQRPTGWGYNNQTFTDADSTAFAIRTLARAGHHSSINTSTLLLPYIDANGHGHTFLNSKKMGKWADAHPDITASIGLAFYETNTQTSLQKIIANASLKSRNRIGVWRGYWWVHPYYATWINLTWLKQAHKLSPFLKREIRTNILLLNHKLSMLDSATLLGILLETSHQKNDPLFDLIVSYLLKTQTKTGAWPPSRSLILPPQWKKQDKTTPFPSFEDHNALFTTAITMEILSNYYAQI